MTDGHLIFPAEVLDELKRGARIVAGQADLPLEWAIGVESIAIHKRNLSIVREVLEKVPEVLDPDKTSGVEEADPYVLACALELRRSGRDAKIITEDKTDKPIKLSLSSAAGLLGIPDVTVIPFLRSQSLLP